MTRLEITSKRKAKAIRYLVDNGEYSAGYASHELEEKHEIGQILDVDYEPLAEYLDELMDKPVEEVVESAEEEVIELPVEEETEKTVEEPIIEEEQLSNDESETNEETVESEVAE